MPKKPWTVVAAYDEDGEPFYAVVEAHDENEALARAKRQADSIIIGIQVFEGRHEPVNLSAVDKVVPIRGRGHEIEVTLVRVTRRKVHVPSRCPKCKRDLTRARALTETFLTEGSWAMHLSHDGRTLEHDRDGGVRGSNGTELDLVRLACSGCSKVIWEGKHVET
jgi:hypothetical protein